MPKNKSKRKGGKKSKKSKSSKQSNIEKLAVESRLKAYGIYDRISKVIVGGKKTWRKNKHQIEDILDNETNFVDKEYVPNQYQLDRLQAQNSKLAREVNWYKLHNFFNKEKYSVTKDCQIRKQVMKNRGYVWIVDALNTLSSQPGLVQQLFEKKKTVREGVYAVWLNFNGKWTQFIIDDHIPIFQNMQGKTQFLFSSPHPKFKEIWYILLEKVMAKAYGGYYRLMQGIENYAVRDLTGAPYDIFDIVYIKPGRGSTKRDRQHMRSFWKKVNHWLKKGYVLSICPREPTQLENVENKKLNIPNKKYYMSKGLYSGHNYAVVTTAEVKSSTGEKYKILKLRNPYLNEKWEGDWSENSPLWTEKLKEELKYNKEKENEFWMSVQDLMGYFECMNIYKTVPGHTFNNLPVEFGEKKYGRVVIRVSVPYKGKYTFSIDQKDLRSYECPSLKYCRVKLTLGKLEESGVTLLSHTSSLKLRNTFIRKSIEKGEYYLLIERINSDENKKWIKKNPELMKNFNEINISSYGPKTCALKVAESTFSGDTIYNYLSYYGWKSYSARRIGKKMSSFKVNFYDQSWNQMSLYLLNIPDSIIYAFKNPNDFGVELKSQIAGITKKEIVGPEGRIGFRQDFSMNSGASDVFILREKDDDYEQEGDKTANHKFQIKSVVGRKFFGTKGNRESFKKVYEFLIKEKGKKRVTEVEKDRILEDKLGLFDGETGSRLEYEVEVVDEVKKKQIVVPMKKEEYEDIVKFDEVEKKEQEVQAEQEERRKTEEERKRKEKKRLKKEEEQVRREFEQRNGIAPKKESQDENHSTEGSDKILQNENQENKIEFKHEENVLQIGDPEISRRRKDKGRRGKSILKNKNRNHSREQKNIIKLETQKDRENLPLDSLLKKTRDHLLELKKSEIKTLMKYYSFKGFSIVYKLDEELTKKLREKLSSDEEGLALMDGKRVAFKSEDQLEEEGMNIKGQNHLQEELEKEIELQKQLEKEIEEQKKLEAQLNISQNLGTSNFINSTTESQSHPLPPQQIQKLESVGSRDDYQISRRNQNDISSIKDLQKPLRSMSRAMSPKFDRSVSKRKLEKNQNRDLGSPSGREILKQNKQNKVTLSQYNMTDGGALSVGLSRMDLTCNLSNLGPRDTLDFSNMKQVRRSCDIAAKSKKERHSYNVGVVSVSNPRLMNKGFKSKNFRNSCLGNQTNFKTSNSLRNSSVKPLRKSCNIENFMERSEVENSLMFESVGRDSMFGTLKPEVVATYAEGDNANTTNFFQKKSNLNPDDNNRLERLKKKLDQRRKLRNIALKKNNVRKSFNQKKNQNSEKKDEIRESKNVKKNRTQEIINKAKQIVKNAHKKRMKNNPKMVEPKKLGMSLNEKLKKVRNKVKNKYSNQNIYEKKMRNTVNLASLSLERDTKLTSNVLLRGSKHISEVSNKRKQFEDPRAFQSKHTSNLATPAKVQNNYAGERATIGPNLSNGLKKYNKPNFRQSLNPTPHHLNSNSRNLTGRSTQQAMYSSNRNYPERANSGLQNQVTPNQFGNALARSHHFISDRKILNEKNQSNIQTDPFNNQFQSNLLGLKKSSVMQNQPSPMVQNQQYQGLRGNKQFFGERSGNLKKISSMKNIQNQRNSYAPQGSQQGVYNPRNRQLNFGNFASPKKKLELNHRKIEAQRYVNSGNVNQFSSPNRIQKSDKRTRGGNILHTRMNSRSKRKNYNRNGQENHSREKQSYLSGIFG